MRLVRLIAAMVCLAPAFAVGGAENKHAVAVIIGNKTYGGDTPSVDFTHNNSDATKRFVLEVLGYRGGNVIDLKDATRNQIEAVFGNKETNEGKLFDGSGPADTIVPLAESALLQEETS